MSLGSRTATTLFHSPRVPTTRRMCIFLLCFYVCVGTALAVVVVAPTVHEVQRGKGEYRAMMSGVAREEKLRDALEQVRARLSMIRSDLVSHQSRALDDRVIHSILGEATDKAGVEIKSFESLKTAGEYSLTIRGALANTVMFTSDGLTKLEWLRVESFTARGIEAPVHWIELHFWLKTTSYTHSPSERCLEN